MSVVGVPASRQPIGGCYTSFVLQTQRDFLVDAIQRGGVADFSTEGAPSADLQAGEVRTLVIELCRSGVVDAAGVRISGATFIGGFDLAGVALDRPISIDSSVFDVPINLSGFAGVSVSITSSHAPALRADLLRLERNLDLSHSTFEGRLPPGMVYRARETTINLDDADIGGNLVMVGATLINPGKLTISGDNLHVRGTFRLNRGFRSEGTIRLIGARVDREFGLEGSTLAAPGGDALYANGIVTGGSLLFNFVGTNPNIPQPTSIVGRVCLAGASVHGQIVANGSTFRNPNGVAIFAEGLEVRSDLLLYGGCHVEGRINLLRATIGGQVALNGSRFIAPGENAVDLGRSKIGAGFEATGAFAANGTIRLVGSTIGGSLRVCDGASIDAAGKRSTLAATGADVSGDIYLNGIKSTGGQIRLRGVRVRGNVEANDGTILHGDGTFALVLDDARIDGQVELGGGLDAIGTLSFRNAHVGGSLTTASGESQAPSSVTAGASGDAVDLSESVIEGSVRLSGALIAHGSGSTRDTIVGPPRLIGCVRGPAARIDGDFDLVERRSRRPGTKQYRSATCR